MQYAEVSTALRVGFFFFFFFFVSGRFEIIKGILDLSTRLYIYIYIRESNLLLTAIQKMEDNGAL